MKKLLILLLAAALLLASCASTATAGVREDTNDVLENEAADGFEQVSYDEFEDELDLHYFAPPVLSSSDTAGTLFGIERNSKITTTFSSDAVKMSDLKSKFVTKTEGGYTYVNIQDDHFSISGFPFESSNAVKLFRLEFQKYKDYSTQLQNLGHNSAGGRVRFKTNATTIKVSVTLKNSNTFAHMPETATHGCDIYVGSGANPKWVTNFGPAADSYTKDVTLPAGIKEVMIVLPLYSGISSMTIGIPTNSAISSPDPYVIEDPVVYYGSSITQGACASRPGMSYPDITTRMLGANLVNLGFSSGALGETVVAETIAKIKMSAFVYDYDHNGGVDNLRATHYNFYKVIRDAQPNVPIIMISRFSQGYSCTEAEAAERRAIIKATYDKAVAAGDTNVYFIDGADVYPAEYRDFCMVDGIHPNDVGMYFVASAIYPVLKEALTKAGYIK